MGIDLLPGTNRHGSIFKLSASRPSTEVLPRACRSFPTITGRDGIAGYFESGVIRAMARLRSSPRSTDPAPINASFLTEIHRNQSWDPWTRGQQENLHFWRARLFST